ncbi:MULTISPECIES: hypothetical protein [Shewanella]|uniref:Uncharacterized protein n=1 Tax=Shewanella marisflavi TaxID=260364 RepID=A0ABX5WRZ9_9GAMM|nr:MULTISPECIES: hypothetical protein [Shewanella]QDF75931.1 hypothetical protein FGA12_12685 [Shewanella marisflavi]
MPRNNLIHRIESLENRIGSLVIGMTDDWEFPRTPEDEFNEKFYHLVHTGQMSWQEYWELGKKHGLHTEFETYADYRKDLLENGW